MTCDWQPTAKGPVCLTRAQLKRAVVEAEAEGRIHTYRLALKKLAEHRCTQPEEAA